MERHRVLAVGGKQASVSAWCAACGAVVEMLTAEEAARRAATSVRDVFRRVEAGEVHYAETPQGHLLICARSIR
ncbi:MAG: hypothetical protein ACJ741_19910 [Pyrinomonadaceae bacterium]